MRDELLLKEHPIMKSKVRILRPDEYLEIRNGVKREKQILMDCLLLSGMRYEEFLKLRENQDWFDGRFIHLPQWAERKVKRRQLERWIRLSIMGRSIIPQLFDIKVPKRDAFDKWLQYNFRLIEGLSAKTFRKTYESWLVFSYSEKLFDILLSQGHNATTGLRHYVNLPFLDRDKIGMKEFVEGWV